MKRFSEPDANSLRRMVLIAAAALLATTPLVSLSGCVRVFTRVQGLPTKLYQGPESKGKVEQDEENEDPAAQANAARGAKSLADAVRQIDPAEEYMLGRSAAAAIVAAFGIGALDDPAGDAVNNSAEQYLNLVGNSLAANSKAAEVFSGYHFAILPSDEINAFAAPGAFIFVTRGLLRFVESEEELAAVLAHEIAHIQGRHGLRSVKSERIVTAFLDAGTSLGGFSAGGAATLAAQTAFGGLARELADALILNGYSRELEREADKAALRILERTGYPPGALFTVLERMERTALESEGSRLLATHDTAQARLDELSEQRARYAEKWQPDAERSRRFKAALEKL